MSFVGNLSLNDQSQTSPSNKSVFAVLANGSFGFFSNLGSSWPFWLCVVVGLFFTIWYSSLICHVDLFVVME